MNPINLAERTTEELMAALSQASHIALFKRNGLQVGLDAEELIAAIKRELVRRGAGLVPIMMVAPFVCGMLNA